MTLVFLVRHGLTAATGSVLSGWTPGISLDDRGVAQAQALAARLAPVPLDAIVTSPLDRCAQTAAAIADGRRPSRGGDQAPDTQVTLHTDERLGECKYGDWTNKPLKKLAKEPLWRVVQQHPSAVRFPGPDGESMPDMQHRAVAAVRDWNSRLGPSATYVICSHGDVIKAIVADALGLHLDQCQRIQADPCSLTVIRYTPLRPFLVRMNDTGGDVTAFIRRGTGAGGQDGHSDAAVGGGAGAGSDGAGSGSASSGSASSGSAGSDSAPMDGAGVAGAAMRETVTADAQG